MQARLITAAVSAAIAAVVLVVGLTDPLEGGIAVLAAVAMIVAVRLISRMPVPQLAWISIAVALALAVTVLILVALPNPPEGDGGTVINPVSAGAVVLMWVYRVVVAIAIAGEVVYVLRLVRAIRALRDVSDPPDPAAAPLPHADEPIDAGPDRHAAS
jgi:hypothetical protein